MGRILDTEIDLDAPPQRVWEELVDFPAWKEWNPFIPAMTGKPEVGARLQMTVSPPGLKPMEFRPTVFAVEPGQAITWGGSFLRFAFRGDHSISLEPLANGGTRVRQRERFRGPMALFMGRMFGPTEQGYHQMNQALKERVEGHSAS
jgi:hypothetical protein